MIERILIAGGVFLAVALFSTGGAFLQRRRVSQQGARLAGHPTLLYFWSENCVPCKTVQTPAVDELERQHHDVTVVRINALDAHAEAQRWGVMTVPTTILLCEDGQPVHINNRVVKLPELKQQLGDLGVRAS